MCEQILKKKTAPQYNSNSLHCKNIAGQVLTYNSKDFHRLNEKLNLEWTMSELGKTISKKSDKKTENQCKNAACEQKTIREKWKFGSNKKLGLE